LELALRWA